MPYMPLQKIAGNQKSSGIESSFVRLRGLHSPDADLRHPDVFRGGFTLRWSLDPGRMTLAERCRLYDIALKSKLFATTGSDAGPPAAEPTGHECTMTDSVQGRTA
jgi:hypothetical protein